jgi:protein-S-isoprenylcysteine O-methyltransferase Ste14
MMAERIRTRFLKIAGYLVPLLQSLPMTGSWIGLMTLPLLSYLLIIFANLPVNLPRALFDLFNWLFTPFLIPEKALILIGLLFLIYSIIYLRIKRKEGLVTSGPYRLMRHPQYFGVMLLTLGLTSSSVWLLNNTFGVGFLSPSQTIGIWFIELFIYILLAYIEEQSLSRTYGESFEKYKSKVSFFIPFLKTERIALNLLISISIPALIQFGLISLQ